jgi:hypothetical protein
MFLRLWSPRSVAARIALPAASTGATTVSNFVTDGGLLGYSATDNI